MRQDSESLPSIYSVTGSGWAFMLWKDEGVNQDRQRSEIQERVGVTQEKHEEKFQREREEH